MRPRTWIVALGLAVVFGGSALVPSRGAAQETSSGTSKRKVRSDAVPVYPPLAREMHMTGRVKIETTIAADGHVANMKVIGGSPLLVNAALDAMKQWRFEPGPKETTETFVFDFDKP